MLKVAKFLFMVIHRRNKTKWLNLAIKLLIVAKATLIVTDKCHRSKWALVFYSSDTHYWTLSRSYPALFVIPFKMHWSSKVTSWWILPIPVVYPNPHQAWLPNHPIILLRSVLRRRTKSIYYLSISQRSYIQTSPFSLHVRGLSYPHVEWSHRKSLPYDSPLIIGFIPNFQKDLIFILSFVFWPSWQCNTKIFDCQVCATWDWID